MLECRDLVFHYTEAEPGEIPDFCFSLELAPGECLAVQGPSGGGKSTLLSLIAGFLEPASGWLGWKGDSWRDLPPWQRPLTTVFQEHNLFEHLPVWANVGLGIAPDLRLGDVEHRRVREGLARVGLEGMHDRLPGELSGGQRQRVALLRALLRRRPLLLLDEPFSGLDAANREALWEQVRAQQQEGVAVLLVSHDSEDIRALADRRCQLDDGRLVAQA
ncbi:thiamine transport system ATP-binding protein [Modicisalibacter ilicicola DSM 19980]|uniref:Thiamine transport system ATP-binding protein n=1 Tax=Modicisalibacter ilicicola DSM 19980 TaxID=1121942 RepID=A0A1M4SUW2_9GAMM|nr:ATP-binding cassette domain-containing protein [Halomonas ilicicola]SHE35968.1 thiamine transport system ATP-binding protein [Halomonas ilicicola DSM 19980]